MTSHGQTIIEQLREDGVETTIGTWNMPMTSYFRSRYAYRTDEFPVADQIFAHSLCLPLHENISSQEQQYIMDHLFEYCHEKS
jgi:dTDP-4-amino-4,6-dideoxygalactose transaminase